MDFISTGTEILKQENVLTPRQKDIIDTEKSCFDQKSSAPNRGLYGFR